MVSTLIVNKYLGNTVKSPVSNHPKCKEFTSGHLQEVVVNESQISNGFFWEEVRTHLLYGLMLVYCMQFF